MCYKDNIYFPKRKFKFFNSLFHSVLLYLVFSTRLFSIVIERGQGFAVRFCGNYYFKLRYCGFTKQFAVLRNFRVISMQFAVFLCYSVWCLYVILCGFAVLIIPSYVPLTIANIFAMHYLWKMYVMKFWECPTKTMCLQNKIVLQGSHIAWISDT